MFIVLVWMGLQMTLMFPSKLFLLIMNTQPITIFAPSTASTGLGSMFRLAITSSATFKWQKMLATLSKLSFQLVLAATLLVSYFSLNLCIITLLLAGFVAYEMGLPIRMVAAVTPNDIVHRTLQTGDFSLSEVVLQTWATAMDIQARY